MSNSMTPDDEKLYEELCEGWRYFATWREKIFAGYIAILGAFGLAFAKSDSSAMRAVILAGCVLVSLVFWILDRRTVYLLGRCLRSASKLEAALGIGQTMEGRGSGIVTLGFGISLLVASVAGVAFTGFCVYVSRWQKEKSFDLGLIALAIASAASLLLVFRVVDAHQREKTVGGDSRPDAAPKT